MTAPVDPVEAARLLALIAHNILMRGAVAPGAWQGDAEYYQRWFPTVDPATHRIMAIFPARNDYMVALLRDRTTGEAMPQVLSPLMPHYLPPMSEEDDDVVVLTLARLLADAFARFESGSTCES